jgi:hypothetical protein
MQLDAVRLKVQGVGVSDYGDGSLADHDMLGRDTLILAGPGASDLGVRYGRHTSYFTMPCRRLSVDLTRGLLASTIR